MTQLLTKPQAKMLREIAAQFDREAESVRRNWGERLAATCLDNFRQGQGSRTLRALQKKGLVEVEFEECRGSRKAGGLFGRGCHSKATVYATAHGKLTAAGRKILQVS